MAYIYFTCDCTFTPGWGEELLNFSEVAELEAWLNQQKV
ncbi:DUF4351 domain-containing protein [Aulosira sp. FACHB-615]|nr:DUF4351 domain-containing protein [Aulosira sp. FACHB-615]